MVKDKDILNQVIIRPFAPSDSLNELTELLHRAYKQLADLGFRYLATHQDVTVTERRVKSGECFVALLENKIIGTVTYYRHKNKTINEWYQQPFVASYGQLAVEPEYRNIGLGSRLMELAESLAQRDKAIEITIDTAEEATHLISMYLKRGYRQVGYIQWQDTNYRSVMLSKRW